jgi:allantoinase
MSAGPAHLAGLGDRKGAIAEGYDADIVIWDPDRSFTVDPAALEHRHPVTPYAGRELFGTVIATYVGGTRAFEAQ